MLMATLLTACGSDKTTDTSATEARSKVEIERKIEVDGEDVVLKATLVIKK